ncbi:MAG: DUF3795 domain-containing protein [Oscillospiraceae bacterium]|nr:DUF3795 domain-containing protein [Oscillospiraceae bacterium]
MGEKSDMKELITLCGDDCLKCPRYNAKTDAELSACAELWFRTGWRDRVLPGEEMRCGGCAPEKSCTYGMTDCTARHGVPECNMCAEFPCGKIEELLERSRRYEKKCEEVCTPEELSALRAAFFNKENNLKKISIMRELSKEQYLSTMSKPGGKMRDITKTAELPPELWERAEVLINITPISEDSVRERQLEAVYENDERTFRHVLLFGEKKNCYVVVVVDLAENSILGFYPLDLNEEYGINE